MAIEDRLVWLGLPDAAGRALLARYFRPRYALLAVYVILASVQSLGNLPVLWLLKKLFDTALPGRDFRLLMVLAGGVLAIRLASSLLALFLRWMVVRIIKSSVAGMRADLLGAVYGAWDGHRSAADLDRLHSRIVNDTEKVDGVCNALLSGMLPAALTSVALLVVLFDQSWALMSIGAVTLPAVWVVSRLARRRLQRVVGQFHESFELFSKAASFALRQLQLTRVQGFEEGELERQRGILGKLERDGVRMSMAFALHNDLQTMMSGWGAILLLVAGGFEVIAGRMTYGSLAVFYFGAGMLYGLMASLLGAAAEVAGGQQSLQHVATLIAATVPPGGGATIFRLQGGFELERVVFAVDGNRVLNGVDLIIPAGARVAIIGANGAGKSTLLALLLGVLRPTEGWVRADGRDFADIDLPALRRQIGVVLQQPGIFRGTVRENIVYGVPEADDAAVAEAVSLAGADELIASLSGGFDAMLGEGGATLSGGEAQRLAIARALLRRPRVLVLDEPTNHLDVVAVRRLIDTVARLAGNPTVVLVSHDARLLELVEVTYRLEGGRLHAMPRHEPARGTAPTTAGA
jgi:ABC-type multidrug transport system fused ATPase/permease subunit